MKLPNKPPVLPMRIHFVALTGFFGCLTAAMSVIAFLVYVPEPHVAIDWDVLALLLSLELLATLVLMRVAGRLRSRAGTPWLGIPAYLGAAVLAIATFFAPLNGPDPHGEPLLAAAIAIGAVATMLWSASALAGDTT